MPKEYGEENDNGKVVGCKLVIIEDVVTTDGQIRKSTETKIIVLGFR
jgi:orotate phosphoribosyltransferase